MGVKSMSAPASELVLEAAPAESVSEGARVLDMVVTSVEPSEVMVDSTAVTLGVALPLPLAPALPVVWEPGAPVVVK